MRGSQAARWRWRVLGLALMTALLVSWRGERQAAAASHALPPHTSPARAAHALADFANHPLLYPNIESWWVESEHGNYTSWRYETQFNCGPRCFGTARVWHAAGAAPDAEPAGPRHGAAAHHELRFTHEYCTRAPLLPLLVFCDEVQTSVRVSASGLALSATASCSLWAGAAPCRALPALPPRLARLLAGGVV